MTLRDRSKKPSPAPSPRAKTASASKYVVQPLANKDEVPPVAHPAEHLGSGSSDDDDSAPTSASAGKKLPRVILRLGPAPGS
jgi:hypothetical protein